MKKAFSVLLFSFIGISFVYEGHAMFSRTGVRGLTGIMEGASRLNALSKTVRPAASLAQSAFTIDPAKMPSVMTDVPFRSSVVPTIKMPSDMFQGQSKLASAMMASTTPAEPVSGLSLVDLCKDLQVQPAGVSVESKIIEQTVQALPSACEEVVSGVEASVESKIIEQTVQALPSACEEVVSGVEASVESKIIEQTVQALPDVCEEVVSGVESSVPTNSGDLTRKGTLQSPKTFNDLPGVQFEKSLPWAKILWSADMLRLESQESGLAKAAFKVAAHHAVQYATSSLVDAAIMFFCPSFVALNPVSFSLSSAWNLSKAVASYAFYGSVTVNPLGLSAMSALQVAHFVYQNPEYVYMAGQTVNKATTLASSWCGNPVIGLATGGFSPLAASVADLGSSFVGDTLKGVSRGVMNFNAMLVEKPVTWLMSGASTVYSKLWAAPATEPTPAYA